MTRHLLGLGALAVGAVLLSFILPQYTSLGIALLLFAGWATSWDILGGWTGQSSLGHAAFVGVGAYSVALGVGRFDLAPWWGALAGMLLAAGLAWGWGRLTFRLHGPYFTLSTIAVAEILRLIAINEVWLTGGAQGAAIFSLPEPFGLDLGERRVQFYLALAYAALTLGLVAAFAQRRFGYYMRAVREDEASAQAAGIDPLDVKLKAFMISGALTALGGAIYGIFLRFLEPHVIFYLPLSVQIALTAIIGGRGTVWGPLAGAALLIIAGEVFRGAFAQANLLIYGVLILVVILFLPRGIIGSFMRRLVRRRYARGH